MHKLNIITYRQVTIRDRLIIIIHAFKAVLSNTFYQVNENQRKMFDSNFLLCKKNAKKHYVQKIKT